MVAQQSVPHDCDKQIIGMVGYTIVSLYDETTVLKVHVAVPNNRVDSYMENAERCEGPLRLKYQVYRRLGQHKNILHCLGRVEVKSGIFSLHFELTMTSLPWSMPYCVKWASRKKMTLHSSLPAHAAHTCVGHVWRLRRHAASSGEQRRIG